MKFINVIIGTIITTIGVIMGYIDCYIISLFYIVSSWFSDLVNAPEELAILITIFLILTFIVVILIILIIAMFLVFIGLRLICGDY